MDYERQLKQYEPADARKLKPRTFGEVCRELRAAGYTNLWSLKLWNSFSPKEPPVSMTDDYIARKEIRSSDIGDWDISDESVVVFVRRSDGARFQIY